MRYMSIIIASAAPAAFATQTLPTVDLGYEIHRAFSCNATAQTYNFTNIPYAQPPVGNLRFAAPVPPSGQNPTIQDGSVGTICPQAIPFWQAIGLEFAAAWVTGNLPFDYNAAAAALANITYVPPADPADPRISEDCLVLDVIVPKSVFDSNQNGTPHKGMPVLIWIYGGGYVFGTKDLYGNPAGLIASSQVNGSAGVIYVAMNYRLGAFGFLAGPTVQSNGTANAGLYDQRLALEWVQTHIAKFGGDPNQVTIVGESAGGGSVMHQITAFGGLKPVPFQRAIPQSPAFVPLPSNVEQENTFDQFLSLLNVSTLQEARELPSSELIAANNKQIFHAPYANYIYGPAVDHAFTPGIPGELLLQGSFAKDVQVLAGHNTNEGVLFADPRVTNDTAFEQAVHRMLGPDIQDSVVDYILTDLYPAKYDGSLPYKTFLDRYILFISEAFLSCNARFLARAGRTPSYAYQFSVPPALHGEDLAYTFYNGLSTSIASLMVAEALHELIMSFALTGVPQMSRTVSNDTMPAYGANSMLMDLNVTGLSVMTDPLLNPRCAWWQKALFY